jgi:hypothetical protein
MADLADFETEFERIVRARVREKYVITPRNEPARYEWLLDAERKLLRKEIADDERRARRACR